MSTTETREDRDSRIVDKYREDLLSGRTLALAEASHRSRFGYEPPINHRNYAHAIKTLGDMASQGDRLTAVASAIVGRVNPYGTPSQLCASVYGAAFQAMNAPYDDVINRASPEPGRYSDNQHAWTLHDRVAVHYWLELVCRPCASTAPGVGWCLQRIADEVGYRPTPAMLKGTLGEVKS